MIYPFATLFYIRKRVYIRKRADASPCDPVTSLAPHRSSIWSYSTGAQGSSAACRRLCPNPALVPGPGRRPPRYAVKSGPPKRVSPSRNALEALNSSAGPHPRHRRTGAASNPVSASSHRIPFETRKIPGRSRNIPPGPGKSRLRQNPVPYHSANQVNSIHY